MDEADDPDPEGWSLHPAASFYGLWPRFAAEDAETDGAAGSEAAPAE